MAGGGGGLGTDAVERIRFKFIGECIKVTLENAAGTETHVLCDSSDATGRDKLGVFLLQEETERVVSTEKE